MCASCLCPVCLWWRHISVEMSGCTIKGCKSISELQSLFLLWRFAVVRSCKLLKDVQRTLFQLLLTLICVFCLAQTEGDGEDNGAGGGQPDHLHPDWPGSRPGVHCQHHWRGRRQEGSWELCCIHDPWAVYINLSFIKYNRDMGSCISLLGQFKQEEKIVFVTAGWKL